MDVKALLPTMVAVLAALIVYDKFVKSLLEKDDTFDPQYS
mgnify:CR=1 FL=1|tara:strand:+ start:89 stop:208 length:120 start_codon:yes stop_codon:yes gene_type:complete